MPSGHARERVLAWTLIGAAALVALVATADAWQRIGNITPGFNLMANLLIGVGDRGGVEPLGQIRAVDGQPVRTHAEPRALVEARPAGTVFRYAVERDGQLGERALENVALRHQLMVLQRSLSRPRLRRQDRILWICLSEVPGDDRRRRPGRAGHPPGR